MKKFLSLGILVSVAMFVMVLTTTAQKGRDTASRAESKARAFLIDRGVNADELVRKDVISDDTGNHVRFSQYIKGIRVYGNEIVTHEKRGGYFTEQTGEFFVGRVPFETPAFTDTDALNSIAFRFWDMTSASAELVYYPQGKELVLAYLVDVRNTDEETNEPYRDMVVVNAVTGEIIDRWGNLQTTATLGTGYGFYSGTVSSFPIDLSAGSYSMFDVPSNGKTTDYGNKTCPPTGCTKTGAVYSSTDSIFGTNGSLSNRESIGVDAHYFAQRTLAYYATLGRNGIDNNNNRNLRFGFMVSRTHYGNNYNNAYWDGASMTYGDGNGSTYRPFDALDVVGHEMTHGITERTSNLQYQKESGAANESFSDIFGAVVEFKTGTLSGAGGVSYPTDWWIGEDLFYSNNPSSPTTAIRNMSNTHALGDPDHYSERLYPGTCSPSSSNDYCGVHTNSGIQNYMFYLLVSGGTNHADATGTVVAGIGLDAAAGIAYTADAAYATSTSTYAQLADAWVNAAKFRHGAGSVQAQQTYNAWKACGRTPTVAP